ncbi:MAG TPA: hypothetical protein VE464_20530 [Streptosporangiaceae bacterium]|jgi:hypothetical protein|nr:hypothetical protein [Streptosporangiaceae bacterium]
MTSQRDETVGHGARDETVDEPIVVERHDEILGGPPADDSEADDVLADPKANASGRDTAAGDGTLPGDELASDELTSDEPASDELAGRPVAPAAGSAGLERDPPPLVVPPGPAPGDPAATSGAATSDAQAAVPEPEAPVTPGTGATDPTPADPIPADATPVATGPVDAGPPAASASEPAGPDGDGVPAAALAEQQWPAIQAMFVDDPKGSVERAAAAADEVAKAFVASLQREQTALRAAWEKDTTTEDLRTALQQYRAFCSRLEGLA